MAKKTETTRTAPVTTRVHKRKGKDVAATVAPVLETTATQPVDPAQPADPAPEVQVQHVVNEQEGAPKRKIEKNREERNGVKRPSEGGMCRAVWDYCDTLHTAEHVPTVKEVKLEAEVRGWNLNNASIEYYQWRKFNGIRGRVKTTSDVANAAPEPEAE